MQHCNRCLVLTASRQALQLRFHVLMLFALICPQELLSAKDKELAAAEAALARERADAATAQRESDASLRAIQRSLQEREEAAHRAQQALRSAARCRALVV